MRIAVLMLYLPILCYSQDEYLYTFQREAVDTIFVIWDGNSNNTSEADTSLFPSYIKTHEYTSKTWFNGDFEALNYPVNHRGMMLTNTGAIALTSKCGSQLECLYRIETNTNLMVYSLFVGRAGMKMYDGFKPYTYPGYVRLSTKVDSCLQYFETNHITIDKTFYFGSVWNFGDFVEPYATQYKANLELLIDAIQNNLGLIKPNIVIHRVQSYHITDATRAKVQDAQMSVSNVTSYCTWNDQDGYETGGDNIHLNGNGQTSKGYNEFQYIISPRYFTK